MHEVMFHKHRKKRLGSNVCDYFVQLVFVIFVIANSLSLYKLLDKHLICRERVYVGKFDIAVHHYCSELIQISLLLQEEQLVGKDALDGVFSYGDFEEFRKTRKEAAELEHEVYVSAKIFPDVGVSHLDRHLLAIEFGFVDVAD
jgi:hypothetical protein